MSIKDEMTAINTILEELDSSDIDIDKAADQYAHAIRKCQSVLEKLNHIESHIEKLSLDAHALNPAP